MPYRNMVSKSVSPEGRTVSNIVIEMARLDKSMKDHADALLEDMRKRELLMVCLKRLVKEMR